MSPVLKTTHLDTVTAVSGVQTENFTMSPTYGNTQRALILRTPPHLLHIEAAEESRPELPPCLKKKKKKLATTSFKSNILGPKDCFNFSYQFGLMNRHETLWMADYFALLKHPGVVYSADILYLHLLHTSWY